MKKKTIYLLWITGYVAVVLLFFFLNVLDPVMHSILGEVGTWIARGTLLALPLVLIIKPNTTRKIVFSAAVLCVVMVSIIALYRVGISYLSTFSPEKWQKYPYDRYRVIDEVDDHIVKKGMTRSDIEALLGKSVNGFYIITKPDFSGVREYIVTYLNDMVISTRITG